MDTKLKHILTLALHPSTNDGEAAAALNRARAIVSKTNVENLFDSGSTPPVKPKTIYRDVFVFTASGGNHETYRIKVARRWQHSLIEVLFRDGRKNKVDVELLEFELIDDGRAMVKIRVHGKSGDIAKYSSIIDGYIIQMNKRNKSEGELFNDSVKTKDSTIKKVFSWWSDFWAL